MANKKYHYYVLVFTEDGPKYVTGIGSKHTAYWNYNEKPFEMPASYAEDVYTGLCLNFFTAILVKSLFEIKSQPYRYENYKIEWKEVNNNDENSD